eukprot:gene51017-35243_t
MPAPRAAAGVLALPDVFAAVALYVALPALHAIAAVSAAWASGVRRELNVRHVPALDALTKRPGRRGAHRSGRGAAAGTVGIMSSAGPPMSTHTRRRVCASRFAPSTTTAIDVRPAARGRRLDAARDTRVARAGVEAEVVAVEHGGDDVDAIERQRHRPSGRAWCGVQQQGVVWSAAAGRD